MTQDTTIVEGTVYGIELKNNKYQITLDKVVYDGNGFAERLPRVLIYMEKREVKFGERIQVVGNVEKYESPTNEGEFDQLRYNQSRYVGFGLSKVNILSTDGKCDRVKEWLYSLREEIGNIIDDKLSAEDAGIMRAMLIGDKASLDESIKLLYQKNGLSHILAISGLHVTLLCFSLYKILRRIGVSLWINIPITITFLLGYGILVGNSISIRRATLMLVIILFGRVLHQPEDALNSLGIFVIISLWDNPYIIYNSGFQFSVIAIIGIAAVGRGFVIYFRRNYASDVNNALLRHLVRTLYRFLGAGGIFLATLPLVMRNYYEVPVYGIIVNLLLLPLATLLIMGGGAGIILWVLPLGLCKALSNLGWMVVQLVLTVYREVCTEVGMLPGANFITGTLSIRQMLCYYVVLLIWITLIHHRSKTRIRMPIGNVLFLAVILFVGFFRMTPPKEYVMLDVGQGLGVYIHSKDMNMFYDGGSTDVHRVGQYRILPFLKSRGVRRIDYWFVSHLDEDHTNGLLELMEVDYPINCIIFSDKIARDEKFERIAALAREKEINIRYMRQSTTISMSDIKITCLWPTSRQGDSNDGSMVLHVDMGDAMRLLLLGDVSGKAEKMMMDYLPIEPVEYVQAAHHGSDYSNSKELLEQLSTSTMLISCGIDNSYGHPGKKAVERMERKGLNVFYTMYQGELSITNKGIVTYRSVL